MAALGSRFPLSPLGLWAHDVGSCTAFVVRQAQVVGTVVATFCHSGAL